MSAPISLVAFDLDDTLAPSKSPLPEPMSAALTDLMTLRPVCIISGGQWDQFKTQVIAHLPETDALANLHLMPTCGTRYDRYVDGAWTEVYAHNLDPELRDRAMKALEAEARRLDLWESHTWGPILEDRGSQITFSALGQAAPVDAKKAWDPDGSKRLALRDAVAPHVPELAVAAGGSTSIDITPKGVDKAYGIARLSEMLDIPCEEILFVGDCLMPGGNDYPVVDLGVQTHAVTDWLDTLTFLNDIVPTIV